MVGEKYRRMSELSYDSQSCGEENSPRTAVDMLRLVVVRGTSAVKGEGDPTALVEIGQILELNPGLLADCVHFIKCRIKVSCLLPDLIPCIAVPLASPSSDA